MVKRQAANVFHRPSVPLIQPKPPFSQNLLLDDTKPLSVQEAELSALTSAIRELELEHRQKKSLKKEHLALEKQAARGHWAPPRPTSRKQQTTEVIALLQEKLEALIVFLLIILTGERQKKGISPRGEKALRHLRYLARLHQASSDLSPEQTLLFETAFGEAYYRIAATAELFSEADPEHTGDAYTEEKEYQSSLSSFIDTVSE